MEANDWRSLSAVSRSRASSERRPLSSVSAPLPLVFGVLHLGAGVPGGLLVGALRFLLLQDRVVQLADLVPGGVNFALDGGKVAAGGVAAVEPGLQSGQPLLQPVNLFAPAVNVVGDGERLGRVAFGFVGEVGAIGRRRPDAAAPRLRSVSMPSIRWSITCRSYNSRGVVMIG